MSTGGGANAPLPPEKLDQLRCDHKCAVRVCGGQAMSMLTDACQHRQAVKEQLRTLGVNDQIKSLVADKRLHPNPVKGKEAGITQQQALEKLKVQPYYAEMLHLMLDRLCCCTVSPVKLYQTVLRLGRAKV